MIRQQQALRNGKKAERSMPAADNTHPPRLIIESVWRAPANSGSCWLHRLLLTLREKGKGREEKTGSGEEKPELAGALPNGSLLMNLSYLADVRMLSLSTISSTKA
jgi:hypothetical protein